MQYAWVRYQTMPKGMSMSEREKITPASMRRAESQNDESIHAQQISPFILITNIIIDLTFCFHFIHDASRHTDTMRYTVKSPSHFKTM